MRDTSWHFWDAGERPGAEQMAIDAELLEAALRGRIGPAFRVYGWRPPAVSLGVNQDPERELDRDAVRRRGYDVVRRPTGGRAILHADELTYAVVARADQPLVGGTIRESHCRISRLFCDALRLLGVAAVMAGECEVAEQGAAADAGAHPLFPSGRTPGDLAPPCFATATGTELVVSGRKILGSAQRRTGDVFLQHGSLLLSEAHLELADLLRADPGRRAAWRRRLESTTTSVFAATGRRVSRDEAIRALAASLQARLGRPVVFGPEPPPGL